MNNQPDSSDTIRSPEDELLVPKDILNEILKTEVSLQHWNNEYVSMALNMRSMENTIQTLGHRKSELLDGALKKLDINPDEYQIASISPEGKLSLVKKPSQPQAG